MTLLGAICIAGAALCVSGFTVVVGIVVGAPNEDIRVTAGFAFIVTVVAACAVLL